MSCQQRNECDKHIVDSKCSYRTDLIIILTGTRLYYVNLRNNIAIYLVIV